tara:strand:+ start:521 stop:685 length:165 start_codon:yes stop_codon:yes gene_type:complete
MSFWVRKPEHNFMSSLEQINCSLPNVLGGINNELRFSCNALQPDEIINTAIGKA